MLPISLRARNHVERPSGVDLVGARRGVWRGPAKHEKCVSTISLYVSMLEKLLEKIQNRVSDEIDSRVSVQESLAISIAASLPRDRDDILGMLLNKAQYEAAVTNSEKLALIDSEWQVLFGKHNSLTRDSEFKALSTEPLFHDSKNSLENALRCTLMEKNAQIAWSSVTTNVCCYVALHAENTEALISTCLGGIVRADSRRLDEVRSEIEDSESDHMLLTKLIIALSKSVCSCFISTSR